MDFLEYILGGIGVVVWFFFRQFLNEQKTFKTDFEKYKNEVGETIGKLRGRVDLLEMDIKSEIKTFKQVSEMQYNQIHSDINELKEMIKDLKK
jgi:hypothetical protein